MCVQVSRVPGGEGIWYLLLSALLLLGREVMSFSSDFSLTCGLSLGGEPGAALFVSGDMGGTDVRIRGFSSSFFSVTLTGLTSFPPHLASQIRKSLCHLVSFVTLGKAMRCISCGTFLSV